MEEKEKFDLFLSLSAVLTGFKKIELLATGLAFTYYETLFKRTGDQNTGLLLKTYSSIILFEEKKEDKIISLVRTSIMANSQLGPIARCLIKLWYLGQWEALPNNWRQSYGIHKDDISQILSPESYKEGLVWKAIAAHPMGAKQTGFDSWSSPPEPFKDN